METTELAPFGVAALEVLCAQPGEARGEDLNRWLEIRRTGLSGSDVAAIFGEHQRLKPIQVWYDKRPDLAPPEALAKLREYQRRETQRTIMGRQWERVIKDWYAAGEPLWPRRVGRMHVFDVPTMRRRDRPWQVLSPDGAGYEPEAYVPLWTIEGVVVPLTRPQRGMEIKTHGFNGSRDLPFEEDPDDEDYEDVEFALPPRLRMQPLWYQSGMEVDEWDVAALIDTHHRRTWTIHRSLELEANVLEESDRWWRRHVVAGIEPEPDGSSSFKRHLRAKWAKHDDVELPRRGETDLLWAELRQIRRRMKADKASSDKIAQRIQQVIGDHRGIGVDGGTITWTHNSVGQVSYKNLADDYATKLGLTDREREANLDRHRGEPPRVFRCPDRGDK